MKHGKIYGPVKKNKEGLKSSIFLFLLDKFRHQGKYPVNGPVFAINTQ